MAEEIKAIHIFAQCSDGKLREVSMPQTEKDMWFEVIGRYYQSGLRLSPIAMHIPLLKNTQDGEG